MADVADHAQTNVSSINNGSAVVGAPKAAGTAAFGSKFVSTPGDASDLGSGSVAKGTIKGSNDASSLGDIEQKLTNRFDDNTYYTS
tara:strand:- start:212 stop:469 length:258 start_codon:yes stop_codon:yes gene_type:complete